jgi:hypothetical protein
MAADRSSSSANRSSANRLSRDRHVRAELGEVITHLQQLQATVAVAVGALRQQNADIDADVASLLQRSVGDNLQEQIDKLEAVLRLRAPPARRKR